MHYRETNPFGVAFEGVQCRDREKAALCAEHGVTLVAIPEMHTDAVHDSKAVLRHVLGCLSACDIDVPPIESVDLRRLPVAVHRLERLHRAAARLGLELLDDEYRGIDHHYRWRCGFCSKTFMGNGYYRLVGRGCPLCWGRRKAEGTRWVSLKSRLVHAGE